jgi:hypothetical protein
MKTKSGLILAVLLASQAVAPAFAQYHYSYGNGRVTNQSQTGLYTPSATYIGSGTLSESAQGKRAGIGGALPAVNMGAHVRTPGDNMYNGEGSDRMYNGALIYQDQKQAILNRKQQILQSRYLQARRRQMEQQQVQQGTFYVPGSNGAGASYGNMPTTQLQYNGNGNATYGATYSGGPKTRQF